MLTGLIVNKKLLRKNRARQNMQLSSWLSTKRLHSTRTQHCKWQHDIAAPNSCIISAHTSAWKVQ